MKVRRGGGIFGDFYMEIILLIWAVIAIVITILLFTRVIDKFQLFDSKND